MAREEAQYYSSARRARWFGPLSKDELGCCRLANNVAVRLEGLVRLFANQVLLQRHPAPPDVFLLHDDDGPIVVHGVSSGSCDCRGA